MFNLIFTTSIAISFVLSSVLIEASPILKNDDWQTAYYKCEKTEEDTLLWHKPASKPATLGVATGELNIETSMDKVITCIKVTDVNHHGYVAVSEGGLHDTAVLLKFKSQLCKGYTFDVEVYEGYPRK